MNDQYGNNLFQDSLKRKLEYIDNQPKEKPNDTPRIVLLIFTIIILFILIFYYSNQNGRLEDNLRGKIREKNNNSSSKSI